MPRLAGNVYPAGSALDQLNRLIKDVLDGKATMETLDVMEETACLSWRRRTVPSDMRRPIWSTRDW